MDEDGAADASIKIVAGHVRGSASWCVQLAPREPVVMILQEEQITVSRSIVPVECVTLTTTSVPGEFIVKETIRHEEIDVDVSPRGHSTAHPANRKAI